MAFTSQHSSSASASVAENVILDSQSSQYVGLDINGHLIQTVTIEEIPPTDMSNVKILNPNDMEYSLQGLDGQKGVIVKYAAADDVHNIQNIELGGYNLSGTGDAKLTEVDSADLQLIDDNGMVNNVTSGENVVYENIEFVPQEVVEAAKSSEQLIPNSDDFCRVQVEVTDQKYMEDLKDIDIFVVYSCKKCGYGDQSPGEALRHSRSCSHPSDREELEKKLSKVFNLFKTFSHRSMPLSQCIAPRKIDDAMGIEKVSTQTVVKETNVSKSPKVPKGPKPPKSKAEDGEINQGITDEDIETIVEKCKAAWKGPEEPDIAVTIEPRNWFCSDCTATVIFSETEFKYHAECHTKTDPETKKFSCGLCKTSEEGRRRVLECDDWNTMKTHLAIMHKVDMKLQCPECTEIFPNHHKYHRHVRSHKHHCQFDGCQFTSTTKQNIYAHERCHSLEDTTMFKCFKCDWKSEPSPRKWNLMHIHLTRNHPGIIEPLYKCKLCSREFAEIRRYNTHVTSCKLLPVPLRPTCLICGKPVQDTELKEHIQKHAMSRHWYFKIKELLIGNPSYKLEPQETNEVQEPEIDATFQIVSNEGRSGKESLTLIAPKVPKVPKVENSASKKKQKRVLVSSGLLTEKCKFCYKKFSTNERLQKHVSRSHPDLGSNLTVCDTCGSSFRNKEQWRNHNRQVHLGIKRRTPNNRNATESKLYMCETCTYASPSIARIRNHYSTVHMGVHPFTCKQCSYKTNEASDLRRHMLKHQGKKPYECRDCDYRTTQRWILVNHAQRVHNVKMSKRSHDTMGCQWSLKRSAVSRGGGGGGAATQTGAEQDMETEDGTAVDSVQYILDPLTVVMDQPDDENVIEAAELSGEVVLQMEESGMVGEAVELLANLAASQHQQQEDGGEVLVQDSTTGSYVLGEDGRIMVQMKQEGNEEGEGDHGGEMFSLGEEEVVMTPMKEEEEPQEVVETELFSLGEEEVVMMPMKEEESQEAVKAE